MDVLSSTTFTINSLLITANSNVTLERTQSGGGNRVFQVASTSSVTKGLQIDNNCTLIVSAINNGGGNLEYTLALTGGAGVTGEVAGNLYIKGMAGCGTEIDLQDDAVHYATLVVKNTGVIKYFTDTDNTSPATGTYLTMESGSTYEIAKNGGSLPGGNWDDNSNIIISGTLGSGITFNQSTYGNLEWNTPLMNATTQMITTLSPPVTNVSFHNLKILNTNGKELRLRTGSGATSPVYEYTVRGNLDVANSCILVITGNGVVNSGAGAKFHVMGNINNEGIIKSEGGAGTINDLELNGTSNQNISNTGTFSGSRLLFIMNNPAGATLNSQLTIPGNLSLLNGKIRTTATNILEMLPNTVATPNLVNPEISFVEGPMRKTGNDQDFTFPVGKGSVYAPITMNTISGADINDVFTAEYIRGNPQSAIGSAYDASSNFDHISYVEYWRLTQDNGNAIKSVAVTVNAASFCKDLDNTFVSRYNPGTGWVNEGRQVMGIPSSSGPFAIATLRIGPTNTISQFGYFTLATNQPFAMNPLPVKLVSFNSTKRSDGKALLEWELAECCVTAVKFQVEKAGADQRFFSIAATGGNETSRFYTLPDNDLKTGINYYRLKIIDVDGRVTYSRVVAVINGVSGVLLNLSPTIITGEARLTITSSVALPLDLLITDMTGRVVLKVQQKIQPGNNTIPLSLVHLHNGAYLIYGLTADGRTNPIPFIKQ